MNDGEKPLQHSHSVEGATETTKLSTSDSFSNSSGGNGGKAGSPSTSSITGISPSASHSSISAFTTNTPATGGNTVSSRTDEAHSTDPVRHDDYSIHRSNSDPTVDTFYTPTGTLQNISGSTAATSKKSANRKHAEVLREQLLQNQEVTFYEGEEDAQRNVVTTDVVTNSPPEATDRCASDDSNSGGIPEEKDAHQTNQEQQPEKASNESSQLKQGLQQHKRESSAGSQCSLSSNPENSQFKTADAHSSDSDDSGNSGTAFGNFNNNRGHEANFHRQDEGDRRSLQSDNSHSGEQLNTSAESVEIGDHTEGKQRETQSPSRLSSSAESKKIGGGDSNVILHQESQLHSVGSKPRVKKKMWYQIFSTSYKTRSGDFKKIFKNLPSKERLIVDYSCALQKEILLQGRMYVSQNFVSFHANIFGWENKTTISFKEIDSITKEKTALIIPNAIQISTMSEKFFFSSFVTRDSTYVMLFKMWQSALLEDNMSRTELWKMVHTFYGEELGVTSEDEPDERYGGPSLPSTSTVTNILTSSQSLADGGKSIGIDSQRKGSAPSGKGAPEINIDKCDDDPEPEEDGDEEPRIGSLEWCRRRSTSSAISGLVCAGEIGPAIAVGLNIGSSIVTSNGTPLSASDQLYVNDANLANIVPLSVPMLPMTVEPSDSSDTEAVLESELRKELPGLPLNVPDISADGAEAIDSGESSIAFVPPVCPVDHSSIGKELMSCIIPCNIDQLFTMLFTNSKFYLDFQLSRKTCDMNQSDWQLGEESHKTRQLTFTVTTGQNIGPKQVQVTETQTLLPESTPGLLYAIESESVNAGIPYADAFSVKCHYCLTQISPNEASIVVISKTHYKKSIWAAKPFIEKSSMAALVDYFNNLDRALKEECAKMNAGGITPTTPIIVSNFSRRRPPRKKGKAPDIPAAAMSRPMVESGMVHHHHHHQVGTGGRPPLGTTVDTMTDTAHEHTESSFEIKIINSILVCLVLLNMFLYYKLSILETATNQSLAFPPVAIQFSGEPPQNHQEWLVLLQKQETLHRTEVQGWHEILASAINILRQAEKDLEALKAHIIIYGKGTTVINPDPPDSSTSDSEKPKQVNPDETPPPPQNPASIEKTEKDEKVEEL